MQSWLHKPHRAESALAQADSPLPATVGQLASPASIQNNAVLSHGSGVLQYMGQITPPASGSPEDAVVEDGKRKDSAQDSTTEIDSDNKLSKVDAERARTTIVSQQPRPRPTRQPSMPESVGSSNGEISETASGSQNRARVHREKNRLAAAKCRQKKKVTNVVLKDMCDDLEVENTLMKRQERELRDQLSQLRTMALSHSSSAAGCQCGSLHQYNQRQAQAMALGLGQSMLPRPRASQSPDVTLSPVGVQLGQAVGQPALDSVCIAAGPDGFVNTSNDFIFAKVTTPTSLQPPIENPQDLA